MALHDLHPAEGSTRARKRKGRGHSAGQGKTCGKGHKGQKARAGGSTARGFEGGQMPLHRRLPKRGFRNDRFARVWVTVDVGTLAAYGAGEVVDLERLRTDGHVRGRARVDGLKVIGNTPLEVAVTVKAHRFTKGAAASIAAAGGTTEVI